MPNVYIVKWSEVDPLTKRISTHIQKFHNGQDAESFRKSLVSSGRAAYGHASLCSHIEP